MTEVNTGLSPTEADIQPRPIELDRAVIDRVAGEFAEVGFDAFRLEELACMEEQNPYLTLVNSDLFTEAHRLSGETVAYRVQAGFVFTHRILRYANGQLPLPRRGDNEAWALLERLRGTRMASITEEELAARHEDALRDLFAGHEEFRELFDSRFSNPSSLWSAHVLLLFFQDSIQFRQ